MTGSDNSCIVCGRKDENFDDLFCSSECYESYEKDQREAEAEIEKEEQRLHDLAMNPRRRNAIKDPELRQLANDYVLDEKLRRTQPFIMVRKQGNKRFTAWDELAEAYSQPPSKQLLDKNFTPDHNLIRAQSVAIDWNSSPFSLGQKIERVRVDYKDSDGSTKHRTDERSGRS